mmetsp:Transcript_10423/g.44358  ORF Transcript_10423/g.44358 Transcript_10423/m.44358 type:complete len:214 (+) Transcript_10423:1607-2248(+)
MWRARVCAKKSLRRRRSLPRKRRSARRSARRKIRRGRLNRRRKRRRRRLPTRSEAGRGCVFATRGGDVATLVTAEQPNSTKKKCGTRHPRPLLVSVGPRGARALSSHDAGVIRKLALVVVVRPCLPCRPLPEWTRSSTQVRLTRVASPHPLFRMFARIASRTALLTPRPQTETRPFSARTRSPCAARSSRVGPACPTRASSPSPAASPTRCTR